MTAPRRELVDYLRAKLPESALMAGFYTGNSHAGDPLAAALDADARLRRVVPGAPSLLDPDKARRREAERMHAELRATELQADAALKAAAARKRTEPVIDDAYDERTAEMILEVGDDDLSLDELLDEDRLPGEGDDSSPRWWNS
jgi:hypothetical protein